MADVDLRSEFSCQSSLEVQNIQIPPLNTSYAWDISHTLAALYHPYAHKPAALTEYPKRKLQVQRAKHQSCSHPAHVEWNVPLGRNINSDLHTLATSNREHLERRGECNIPKRYLKNVEWAKQGPLGVGYYIGDLDDESEEPNIIPVDFNFQALQWGLTYKDDNHFILERPAPVKLCKKESQEKSKNMAFSH